MTPYTSSKIRIISFFSILLVVFLHAYNLEASGGGILFDRSPTWLIEDFISYGITRIAVPLFFTISGFLFFLGTTEAAPGFGTKIKKRFRTLLVPFLFWSVAGILFYYSLQNIPQLQKFFSKELIRDYSFEKWITTIFVHPIPYQFWFIRDLMVMVLVSPLLYFAIRNFGKIAIGILFLLWLNDFGPINNSIEALLFFLSGGYLGIHMMDVADLNFGAKSKWFCGIWLLLLFIKSTLLYLGFCEPLCRIVFKGSIIFGILALWGLYDVAFQDKEMIRNRLVKISGFTFFIYAFHEPLLTIFKKGLFTVFGNQQRDYLFVYLAAPIFVIVLSVATGMFLKRYMNRFYTIITGGR